MAIGRTDERHNRFIPVANKGRPVVWMSFADPIWASGNAPASTGRTHDRIRTKANISQTYFSPTGRLHMGSCHISCYQKAIIIYDGSDITRAEGADQLGRPRVYLGFPLEVLGKPAATRLNHCP
jgi:hypothetical protein